MQMSTEINELAAALAKAQPNIEGAVKDRTNPAFKSKYADLSSVMEACKSALNAQGLSFVQAFVPSDPGTLALSTVLLHTSGQWISGIITMPLQKNDPQGYGSAATYARRYGLAAMVGVCPDDDDGNQASGRPPMVSSEGSGDGGSYGGNGYSGGNGHVATLSGGVWEGPGQCPACHAPEGKPHAKACKAVSAAHV